ncbi:MULTISPECIES: ABC transporter ATP-binding protein [Flavobacterium]|uniref:ABC transporter ATP-binding protein n=4 Tax=Flavobacterium TaxID=237 RepID=A0AA94F0A2_9FLAO|nr:MULTISPECIES: ATP-binding cassette domain-containing protein [Flavobacterium]OXA82991.1 ABC transporter ATP-binding protein [Flavobacterium columnare NBRC 100251 = ATCC 23463]AMA49385.1 ABC transporter ATP-binding protein [Flavobacterium covae]AND63090.1 ABC transporter ATP-binding protein [Flavobacterium covae]MCH4828664.1 ATP-binding cassette domain-containing protein [Flavobacterium columnare]MCH4831917.1 ATP-binding cassette domain-containing protein [Flavobacterium columnare]
MNNILEVNNVVKQYGNYTALNSISLQVPKGSIYGLLGPNGAGKTSLIRIINQITMPDSGEVFLDAEKLAPHHVSYIGYMPEERGLYKTMKVGEQALYLAQLKGMPHTEAKKQLKYWFEKLGIEGWWDKKIQELSKGMAQKIQFIVTILHQPKLLILDEPFSGFDPVNANLIKDEIIELNKQGTSIIFSTHRMESVEEMCDYIALIHKSNKLIEGKVSDVKKEYRTHKFQVGILSDNVEKLMYELTQKFTIGQTAFKSLNNDLKLEIDLGDRKQNELLEILIKNGQVTHFAENIPSINDIFIQTVTNKK